MNGPRAQTGAPFVPGTLIAGKYRLIKQIGEGAMGVVWSAVNEGTSGEIALKLIWKPEPEYRVRLLREAKACGNVRHKNVIQIHDVGQTDGGDPFLVMELLSGGTLAELLERKRRLPPPEAAAIGRDIARGLAAAHAKGIVHRDLKPANIFLHNEPGEDAPVIKVLDFGVAKNLALNDGLRTAAGGAVGSPVYMSPEQARRDRDIDERADIWSLGVVLFEMLTGERPFRGDLAEVLYQIQEGEIPTVARRMRRIDPAFDALVTGCLTRNRDDRLGPALEVARLLDEHAGSGASGRDQLPSLIEESPLERGPSSISANASFSPGLPPLQPSPVPGLRPSSSGHGSTGFVPSAPHSASAGGYAGDVSGSAPVRRPSGTYSVTEPLSSPSFPRPSGAPQVIPDDDAATHRLDPRMIAPRAAPPVTASSDGTVGPRGTVRIDVSVVDEAIAARGHVPPPSTAAPTAPPPPPPPSSVSGGVTAPLPTSGGVTAPLPAMPLPSALGATSSTAPVLAADAPAQPASLAPQRSRRKLWVALGATLASLAAVGAVVFVVFGKTTQAETEVATPPLPAPSASPTASAEPAPPQSAAPAPTAVEPAPTSTASEPSPTTTSSATASETTTSTTSTTKPKLSGKLPAQPPTSQPCKSKFGFGAGCQKNPL